MPLAGLAQFASGDLGTWVKCNQNWLGDYKTTESTKWAGIRYCDAWRWKLSMQSPLPGEPGKHGEPRIAAGKLLPMLTASNLSKNKATPG